MSSSQWLALCHEDLVEGVVVVVTGGDGHLEAAIQKSGAYRVKGIADLQAVRPGVPKYCVGVEVVEG